MVAMHASVGLAVVVAEAVDAVAVSEVPLVP